MFRHHDCSEILTSFWKFEEKKTLPTYKRIIAHSEGMKTNPTPRDELCIDTHPSSKTLGANARSREDCGSWLVLRTIPLAGDKEPSRRRFSSHPPSASRARHVFVTCSSRVRPQHVSVCRRVNSPAPAHVKEKKACGPKHRSWFSAAGSWRCS